MFEHHDLKLNSILNGVGFAFRQGKTLGKGAQRERWREKNFDNINVESILYTDYLLASP